MYYQTNTLLRPYKQTSDVKSSNCDCLLFKNRKKNHFYIYFSYICLNENDGGVGFTGGVENDGEKPKILFI